MEHTRMIGRMSRRALSAVAVLGVMGLAACQDSVSNDTLTVRPDPAGGSMFRNYAAIGTSIGAGIQSGGINDSTQREAYTYLLARAMGLTPGVDWYYPSFAAPGCPPPFTNILTNARVAGGTAATCLRRSPGSAAPYMNNVSIPSLRAAQAVDITNLDFPPTDSLKLAQFITGSYNPLDMVARQGPTFVTVEVGANDVLGAATRGDPALLTSLASFTASITAIADRLDGLSPKPSVAIANVPNVTRIPHFTSGATLFCLKTGACPGVPATVPFSLPTFTVDASCAPTAPAVGSQYLLVFSATATIVNVLSAGGAANLNCGTDVATVTTGAGTASAGATINATEYAAITARVGELNTAIATLAAARGYAVANFDSALAANQAQIPPIPSFTTPSTLFGPLFSLDGVHPNRAGHRITAQTFAAAINAKFGTAITIP